MDQKSRAKTYRIESLESMGALRSEGSTGDADGGVWYHGEKRWGEEQKESSRFYGKQDESNFYLIRWPFGMPRPTS